MKRNVTAVAGLVLGLMMASTAEAQMARPVQFGIGAGISIPGGEVEGVEVGDVLDNGYHVQGMLAFKAPMFPVGLRLDVMYHTFEASDIDDLKLNTLAGTLNAQFEMGGMMASPYLTGGIGMYNLKSDYEGTDEDFELDETEFGLNGGAGIKFNLAGFGTFLEARYHHVMTEDAISIIPITFGIMF